MRVIEPFYSVAALVVIPFFEHELEVAGLESACKVSVCPRERGNAYSAEKFARWRILVTAAESWRWEEEEAARRVPLGREMDMADVDFLGGEGGRVECNVEKEGRDSTNNSSSTRLDDDSPDAYTNVRASSPCSLDPPLATFGQHRIADDRGTLVPESRSLRCGEVRGGLTGWVRDDIIHSTRSFFLPSFFFHTRILLSFSRQREYFRYPLPPLQATRGKHRGWMENG